MGLGSGFPGLLGFSWTRFLCRNAWKNIMIISHSTLCHLHLPRQMSRQVLILLPWQILGLLSGAASVQLISASICYSFLVPHAFRVFLNLPGVTMVWKNPSFVSSIAFATLASGLLNFRMHLRVLKDKYSPRASCGQPITRHF
ncbi:hypothetical protein V6N12_050861 [Hibiscus sabdariffa]|uniref:Uncharacterized protein n=1 Tax=Hibiscus sabdariffa TaxID=183260 RepID=A0ABR2GEG7_9ROSI